jgi:threonine dehydrogenase-like Zn-dependent dehydrogenase
MKALCWHGKKDVRIDHVPEPSLINERDVIIKVTATAICGSDLHLYNGFMSGMKSGDILGHEFMGEVVEIGSEVKKLKVGDQIVVPFTICCGNCFFCKQQLFSLCDMSNPNAALAKEQIGHSTAGFFGYSHLLGGFSGGQAEYVRVPFADVASIKVPRDIDKEKVLFLSDILPTGYMAAENCVDKGDTVAIWGCGPVGQFTIQSAWMLGAARVIAIDYIPERLKMAEELGQAETINFKKDDVYDRLLSMTKGRGPDACIDAVGAEAHGPSFKELIETAKETLHLNQDHPYCIQEILRCCRPGGKVSIPGAYLNYLNHLPFNAAMNKGLTFKMGQTHVPRYLKPLLKKILNDELDPAKIITHRLKLSDAPGAYHLFNTNKDECLKVVLTP